MKKIGLLFIPLVLMFSTCEKKDDGINPDDPVNIPDKLFLEALIKVGVDADGNGQISYAEAEVITDLNVGHSDFGGDRFWPNVIIYKVIEDITGLEAFINLKTLILDANDITKLDLTHNSKLELVSANGNLLQNIDVSNCPELCSLYVGKTSPISDYYSYNRNRITSLDLTNNTKLKVLKISENHFLPEIDLSKNTELTWLECTGCLFNSLDISNNSKLVEIRINCPNLYKVCVWTKPFPPVGVSISMDDNSIIDFTTDCSK